MSVSAVLSLSSTEPRKSLLVRDQLLLQTGPSISTQCYIGIVGHRPLKNGREARELVSDRDGSGTGCGMGCARTEHLGALVRREALAEEGGAQLADLDAPAVVRVDALEDGEQVLIRRWLHSRFS